MITVPSALRLYRQFINWEKWPDPNSPAKPRKVPIDSTTGAALAELHHPAGWITADEALANHQKYGHGVGFVLTEHDPFFLLDVDNAYTAAAGWTQLAQGLAEYFQGCYYELSQSGTGCHLIGALSATPPHGCKNGAHGLEFYTEKRFIALTGTDASGTPDHIADTQCKWLIDSYFTPADLGDAEWTDGPCDEWNGTDDDTELLAAAMKSGGAFSKAKFAALWTGDADVLSRAYPPINTNDAFDRSSADAALLTNLAFWTGKNCERMERLFYSSALADRPKWRDNGYYRRRTTIRSCGLCNKVYSKKAAAQEGDSAPTGSRYLPVTQQIEMFKGFAWVSDVNKILAGKGELLNQSQFKARYGGYSFNFAEHGKKETRDAWESFTQNQLYDFPKVSHTYFRPDRPPGEISTDTLDRKQINAYVPANIKTTPGDVTPFLQHLHKLLPNDNDRAILLAYLAACVQHIGVKFQWCPVVQGVEGNGKSLFARCIAEAIGTHYVAAPNASDLANKFNAWIENRLLIVVEEVRAAGKWEIMEALKPMITQDFIEVQAKGQDQRMTYICANFFMCSNHKDAVVKTSRDRRYSVFYTAQQNEADLKRDGMHHTDNYFPPLYRWLKTGGGFAHVTHFLQNYAIPDALNPATECHRAPDTTSTIEAIKESLGRAEQEVMNAIDEGREGFRGGWISSHAVDSLIDEKRVNKPMNKRTEMLTDFGYIKHPGLRDGRTNNPLNSSGGRKPRLYIKAGHPAAQFTGGAAIAAAYDKAQEPTTQATLPRAPAAIAVLP